MVSRDRDERRRQSVGCRPGAQCRPGEEGTGK